MTSKYYKESLEKSFREKGLLEKCAQHALRAGIITLEEIPTLNEMLESCESAIRWKAEEYEKAIKEERNDNE